MKNNWTITQSEFNQLSPAYKQIMIFLDYTVDISDDRESEYVKLINFLDLFI